MYKKSEYILTIEPSNNEAFDEGDGDEGEGCRVPIKDLEYVYASLETHQKEDIQYKIHWCIILLNLTQPS